MTVGISHHLPDKNWGRELIHTGAQEDFDRLVTNPPCDIAVYGHIHQQLLRYGTGGQLIVNPGLDWTAFLSRCPVAEGLPGPVYDFGV